MEKNSGEVFQKLKKDISVFLDLKLELLKLNTYERIGKVTAILSYGIVLLLLAFFTFLFIFLTLGFYLGGIFNSLVAGFGTVALLYILLIILAIVFQHKIKEKILNLIISALMSSEDDKNISNNNHDTTTETATTGNTEQTADPNTTIAG